MTPDNRIRVPSTQENSAYNGEINRDNVASNERQQSNSVSASRLSASSRASSRGTLTPTNAEPATLEVKYFHPLEILYFFRYFHVH